MPVIPANWEAEAGEPLEPKVQVALSRDHSTALQPNRAKLHLKKKRKERRKRQKWVEQRRRERRGYVPSATEFLTRGFSI